jgi:hypothetical protein
LPASRNTKDNLKAAVAKPLGTRYKQTMSTRQLIEKEVAEMPETLQREVYDFARFLRHKNEEESFNGLLLSETALAMDWNTPEEDAAWASL